jgi:hypothetical protein
MRRRRQKVGAVNEIEVAEDGLRIRGNGVNRNFQQLPIRPDEAKIVITPLDVIRVAGFPDSFRSHRLK